MYIHGVSSKQTVFSFHCTFYREEKLNSIKLQFCCLSFQLFLYLFGRTKLRTKQLTEEGELDDFIKRH